MTYRFLAEMVFAEMLFTEVAVRLRFLSNCGPVANFPRTAFSQNSSFLDETWITPVSSFGTWAFGPTLWGVYCTAKRRFPTVTSVCVSGAFCVLDEVPRTLGWPTSHDPKFLQWGSWIHQETHTSRMHVIGMIFLKGGWQRARNGVWSYLAWSDCRVVSLARWFGASWSFLVKSWAWS